MRRPITPTIFIFTFALVGIIRASMFRCIVYRIFEIDVISVLLKCSIRSESRVFRSKTFGTAVFTHIRTYSCLVTGLVSRSVHENLSYCSWHNLGRIGVSKEEREPDIFTLWPFVVDHLLLVTMWMEFSYASRKTWLTCMEIAENLTNTLCSEDFRTFFQIFDSTQSKVLLEFWEDVWGGLHDSKSFNNDFISMGQLRT